MKKPLTQAFSVAFLIILITNMILFALNRISVLMFWSIIILGAVTAYLILPRIN